MSTRLALLNDLVFMQGDIKSLRNELSKYPWDSEVPLLTITKTDIALILRKYLDSGGHDYGDIADWADALECRDYLAFESEELQEIIFELANPEINGPITRE